MSARDRLIETAIAATDPRNDQGYRSHLASLAMEGRGRPGYRWTADAVTFLYRLSGASADQNRLYRTDAGRGMGGSDDVTIPRMISAAQKLGLLHTDVDAFAFAIAPRVGLGATIITRVGAGYRAGLVTSHVKGTTVQCVIPVGEAEAGQVQSDARYHLATFDLSRNPPIYAIDPQTFFDDDIDYEGRRQCYLPAHRMDVARCMAEIGYTTELVLAADRAGGTNRFELNRAAHPPRDSEFIT